MEIYLALICCTQYERAAVSVWVADWRAVGGKRGAKVQKQTDCAL